VCDWCFDYKTKNKKFIYCQFCGSDEKQFYGLNAVNDFLTFLFDDLNKRLIEKRKDFKLKKSIPIKLIAHNSRAYDIHFVIKYFLENNFLPKKVIKRGTKILTLNIKHIQFLDSLSFLPMPLSSLPKTFGIESLEKGLFPHKFNQPKNWNAELNGLPPIEFYLTERMSEQEKTKFFNWYNSNKHLPFNFKNEIIKYCQTDVKILMRSVMCFRELWKEIFSIDILTRNITLAQAVFEVYKLNFLKPMSIAIIPQHGYDRKRKQSYISNAWLDFMQLSRTNDILREYRLFNYIVDGFIPETKEILEMYGCIFHGCNRCFISKRRQIFNPISGKSMEELYS
jgi:hypothetical protein